MTQIVCVICPIINSKIWLISSGNRYRHIVCQKCFHESYIHGYIIEARTLSMSSLYGYMYSPGVGVGLGGQGVFKGSTTDFENL